MNDTNDTVAMREEDGGQLLDEVYQTLSRYVCFASEVQADAVTLWIAATYALSARHHATHLVITSPQKRCGKSRLGRDV